MKLSHRIGTVEPSATLAMTARAAAMRAQGIDILTMAVGEPDFDTPEHIKLAAKQAIDAGDTKYTAVAGTPALRQAVAHMMQNDYQWSVKPTQVIVGTGGKQVLFNAVAALINPFDEALFATPYWVSYPDMIKFAGGTPIGVAGPESQGFLPKAIQWQEHITDKTRLLILNSPSNPTGAVYSRQDLMEIAELLRAHPQIFMITDDIYSGLVYDDPFVSLAHVAPDLRDRLLVATGVSKTYAMTGWRIGFGIGPVQLIAAMADLQGASTSNACSIAQAAATAALGGDPQVVQHMRQTFKARRDRIMQGLQSIPHIEVFKPQGAFYVFIRVSNYLKDTISTSHALCEHLLEKAHLAAVPGSAFGSDAHIRLSFACSDAQIDEGIRRLALGLKMLRVKNT